MADKGLDEIIGMLKKGDDVTIAGLGDSLTYGWMVDRGFFDRFVDMLEKRYPDAGIRRINAGIPGDTADGGSRRIHMVLNHNPDLVTVQFGLNDLYMGVSIERYSSAISKIVQDVRESHAVPVLVISCPLYEEDEQALAEKYYDVLRRAGEEQGVAVADLSTYWRSRRDLPQGWAGLLQSDGVHPTDTGHEIMARGMMTLFE